MVIYSNQYDARDTVIMQCEEAAELAQAIADELSQYSHPEVHLEQLSNMIDRIAGVNETLNSLYYKLQNNR